MDQFEEEPPEHEFAVHTASKGCFPNTTLLPERAIEGRLRADSITVGEGISFMSNMKSTSTDVALMITQGCEQRLLDVENDEGFLRLQCSENRIDGILHVPSMVRHKSMLHRLKHVPQFPCKIRTMQTSKGRTLDSGPIEANIVVEKRA